MQKMHYHFLIVGVLFFQVLDVVPMQPAGQMEYKVSSLKKLCINTLSKMIDKDNIDELLLPQTIEKCFLIPDELSKKVTINNFCHKFGHEFVYKQDSNVPGKKLFYYRVMFDEFNNNVIVKEQTRDPWWVSEGKDILKTFAITGQEKDPFPGQNYCNYGHSGSFSYYIGRNMITIIKNGIELMGSYECPIAYVSLKRALRNQQELCLKNIQRGSHQENKKSLFNFMTQSIVYENVDDIQFNVSETICMVKYGDVVIISEMIDGIRQSKRIIAGVEHAALSPNGELLFVILHDKMQSPQLISVKDGKEKFSFKSIEWQASTSSTFSYDGRYLIISEPVQHPEYKMNVFDIQTGAFCLSVTYARLDVFVLQKYIVLGGLSKTWFIPTKNLHTMRDFKTGFFPDCRLKELENFGIAKVFNNFITNYHPSGDFIVIDDEGNTRKLIDIKSGKVVITFDNSKNLLFSEPQGSMLCIEDADKKGHEIFLLRNDFTIAEYLLIRFMSEKNIPVEGLVQYPHMQKIYDSMPIDKRLFSCSRNGVAKAIFLQEDVEK